MKKYGIIILILIGLMIFLAPAPTKEQDPLFTAGKVNIALVTDIHHLSPKLYDEGEAFMTFMETNDGKHVEETTMLLNHFTQEVKNKELDLILITGDLTFNGERESFKEILAYFKTWEDLGAKVAILPGNHDLNNPWALSFRGDKRSYTEGISEKVFEKALSTYGLDLSFTRDKGSLSYGLKIHEDLWFAMIDTSQYKDNLDFGWPVAGGLLKPSSMEWLKELSEQARAEGAHLAIAMHHSLLPHNPYITEGYVLDNQREALDLFTESGIDLVFTGHVHIQDIAKEGSLYDLATGAFSVYPVGYGLVTYDQEEGALVYEAVTLDLPDFNQASKSYFYEEGYGLGISFLGMDESLTNQEVKDLGQVVGHYNLSHFAGREGEDYADLMKLPGTSLWQELPQSFLRDYLESILQDPYPEDRYLRYSLQ